MCGLKSIAERAGFGLPLKVVGSIIGHDEYQARSDAMSDDSGPDQPLREPTPLNPLRGLLRQVRLVWCLLRDRRVPLWLKVIPFLSLAYLAIPADIVPDV